MKKSELQEALVQDLRTEGVNFYSVDTSGKHPKLRFEFKGRKIMFPFSGTPSDRRVIENARSDLRRVMGLTRSIIKSHRLPARVRKPLSVSGQTCPLPQLLNPALSGGFAGLVELRDRMLANAASAKAMISEIEQAHRLIYAPQLGICGVRPAPRLSDGRRA